MELWVQELMGSLSKHFWCFPIIRLRIIGLFIMNSKKNACCVTLAIDTSILHIKRNLENCKDTQKGPLHHMDMKSSSI